MNLDPEVGEGQGHPATWLDVDSPLTLSVVRVLPGIVGTGESPGRGREVATTRCKVRRKEMFYLTTHSTHFIYGYMGGRREMFYLTMHSTHFIYGYMASDML